MKADLPTVLFVDDEASLLEGLRRKLHSQEWRMLFATSGAEALEIMAGKPVDAIVSDMRMPGMDGAALLEEVRRRYPATIRFILSGHADRESFFRTLLPTHQYFAKPCDTDHLVRTVERALAIRKKLHSPELLALISASTAIPTFPMALLELFEEIQSPAGSVAEVGRIVASDVGLTAQVLRLVNSSYFSLPSRVADVRQAVHLLGLDLVRSVAVVSGVFGLFQTIGVDMEKILYLEELSLLVGTIALRIAKVEAVDKEMADQIHCAGMLSHIGSLFLFASRPQEMTKLQHDIEITGEDVVSAERRQFGAAHPELGGALLQLWGFSDAVVEAVLYHHHPSDGGLHCSDILGPITIVHAAQFLARIKTEDDLQDDSWKADLDLGYLNHVDALQHLDKWAREAVTL